MHKFEETEKINFESFLRDNSKNLSQYALGNPSKWLVFSRRMQWKMEDNDKIVDLLRRLNILIVNYEKPENLFHALPKELLITFRESFLSRYPLVDMGSFTTVCEDISAIFSRNDDMDSMPKIRDIPIPYLAAWIDANLLNLFPLGLNAHELRLLLPHLKYVNLRSYCASTFIPYLSHVQHLSFFDLKETYLETIKTFKDQLISLDMSGCNIGDNDLLIITQFTKLTSLDLSFCKYVTPKGLESLQTMTWLQNLNLTACSYLDEPWINTLRKSLPDTKVRFDILKEDAPLRHPRHNNNYIPSML